MIADMLQEAVQRGHEHHAADTCGRQEFIGRRACFDVARRASRSKDLCASGRFMVQSLACNGVWTNQRAKEAGFITDGTCPLCGQQDTLFHRLWECQHPSVREARGEVVPWRTNRRVIADQDKDKWTLAVLPHPADHYPAPASEYNVSIWNSEGT